MTTSTLLIFLSATFLGLVAGFGMGVGIKVTDYVIKYYEKKLWILQ